jgi:triphosphatase
VTGADAFALVMRACLAQVCGNAHILHERRNAEALRQLRVDLRRLHAALAAFKPILRGGGRSKIGSESKWMGRELDRARDLDVFIENNAHSVKDESEDDSRSRALGDRLSAARTKSYDRAIEAVDSTRFALLVLNCAEGAEIGSWRRNRDKAVAGLRDGPASTLACAALDRLSRKLRKAGEHLAALAPNARHRARIKAKVALCGGILCGGLWSSFEGPPLEIPRWRSCRMPSAI